MLAEATEALRWLPTRRAAAAAAGAA
eukprot:COSAG01_NODE_26714_length_705_cov_0.995050_1_plen_25_part_10